MKKILLVYLTLIPFVSFAQIKGDIAIEWLEKKEMSFGNFTINIPQFVGNCYDYDTSKKALFYTLNLSESNSIAGNSVQITNVVYETLATSSTRRFRPGKHPKNAFRFIKNQSIKRFETSISGSFTNCERRIGIQTN